MAYSRVLYVTYATNTRNDRESIRGKLSGRTQEIQG